jgi:SAM-dependent methyltransferase
VTCTNTHSRGKDNYAADRAAADEVTRIWPETAFTARANRAFLGRAVRFLAANGVRQYLDIGSGIPTEGNVHEITATAAPGAHVVYVDIDPIAVAHSQAILASTNDAAAVCGDLRAPRDLLADEDVRRLIDFGQPVALLLVFVLHFISDADRPRELIAELRDALAPGSYLVVSHATADDQPRTAQVMKKMYDRTVSTPIAPRSHAEILRFFDGFELVDPGLVPVPEWRPESPAPPGFWGSYAGVAKKR